MREEGCSRLHLSTWILSPQPSEGKIFGSAIYVHPCGGCELAGGFPNHKGRNFNGGVNSLQ